MKPLRWKTVKRKVNDLIPFEKNPRKLTEERQQRLIASLEKFNLAEIPIINLDNTLIGGNQRCKILQLVGRGEELIDVRLPNRQLSELELKEYALTSNTHAGEWDFDILETEFGDFNLDEFDIKIPEIEMEVVREIPRPPARPVDETKRWFVYCDCVTEQAAQKMYDELVKRGFETKVVN